MAHAVYARRRPESTRRSYVAFSSHEIRWHRACTNLRSMIYAPRARVNVNVDNDDDAVGYIPTAHRRPCIGVTLSAGEPNRAWPFHNWLLRYFGARGIAIAPDSGLDHLELDGLLVSGGSNISPDMYGGERADKARIDVERDTHELALTKSALRSGQPILGVCRGAQLLNVTLGGDLYQDVRPMRARTSNRQSPFPVKRAEIAAGSRLQAIYETSSLRINSLHHQAIHRLGSDLQAVAHDEDGLIQAVEYNRGPWVFGVQWHPEYLFFRAAHRRIYQHFTDAAREYAACMGRSVSSATPNWSRLPTHSEGTITHQ